MDFKLAPDVNTVLIFFFLNSFRSLGPRIGTHGSLMVFFLLFWSLLYGLLMFRKYSVAMLMSVFLLYSFSVKFSIKKSISPWRCFSVHILYARERKPLNSPNVICSAMFELALSAQLLLMFCERFWNHKSYYQCSW